VTDLVHVSDHAVLRYLERAHGLDVDAIRRHLAGRVAGGAKLKAAAVTVEHVKLVLEHRMDGSATVTTALKVNWPSRRTGDV